MTRRLALLALLGLSLLSPACDKGTPVAPEGAILRISAYPTRIGKTGSSTLTVSLLRSNGNPVNEGTEVRLSSNLGMVDAVVYTDVSGVAVGTLRGDGTVGTATVTAFSGANEAVTTEVAVGQLAASMSLQVTPSNVPESGGILDLLALVRDDQAQPLPEAQVNFRSEVGSLDSGGRFIVTNAQGEARDELTVTAADLQNIGGNTFQVTAEVGGTGGGIISRSFEVSITRPPQASFTFQVVGNTVTFTDTSTGGPTGWTWSFGDSTPVSTQRNPVHTYSAPGSYVVTLTARNSIGSDSSSNVVQINQ